MYLKITRLKFLIFVAATASSISLLGAAARIVRPKYITAAILIDLKPKLFVTPLRDLTRK